MIQTQHKHTKEAFGVQILTSQHRDIRRLKRNTAQARIHGNKFWRSSYLLMDYLQNNPPMPNCKILELGCGWGLAGIHCAKYYRADITALDADETVFPYLQLHANCNNVIITTHQQTFERISQQQLSEFDLIIASDICFWDELTDTVYKLIKRAIAAGVASLVITDPGRAPFFTLAQYCIDQFYAELFDISLDTPHNTNGCALVIENA